MARFDDRIRKRLLSGLVIPAHPLALNRNRKLDERRQRAVTRYYLASGAGGVAVGVHTTQFRIRDVGLLAPVLALATEETRGKDVVRVAGIIGPTDQAVKEARLASGFGYHAGLVSLGGGAWLKATNNRLIDHVRAIAEIIPVFGFYLQPAVGGRVLDEGFWRRFVTIENVVAIKVAPFDRYRTQDVVRAVAASGRSDEIALYTGNDDHIIHDLLAPGPPRFVGGLLGHWAFWARNAVRYHRDCRRGPTRALLRLADDVTRANAAVFDAANGFRGCIPGIHEILRGQGLLAGRWTLDKREELSPGQQAAIDRIRRTMPHLNDDDFVKRNIDRWMK